jgi:penicillin-binding protein 1C
VARLRWLSWRAALALLAGIALAGMALAIAVLGWNYPIDKLDPGRGGPLLLLDRHGQVLRSVPAADGRRGAWTRLADLPPLAVTAILAAEDERFFAHPGVDLRAIARALWLDLRAGRAAFGASTVTMQLVRLVEHPRAPRTLRNKIAEVVLALRLERAMAKRQILEQYLNRAYFGRGAYGLDAAARTYFGKPAAGLADGEATLLAVLPRAPARYDPLRHPPRALTRRHHVLGLLRARGRLTGQEVAQLEATPPQVLVRRPGFAAPHFCEWLLAELPADLLARGGVVHTTLDLGLQVQLERRIRDHVASLQTEGVGQAGAVVLDSQSGEVVALAGSVDYAVSALDIATWKRHPGSALKPFLYALALEDGAHPASLALDIHAVPSDYHVRRLTQPERGPVRLRNALAGSLNLAAVHTLEQVGIPKLMARLDAAGIGPLPGTAGDYGLRLALGAARVRLLDVVAAYGFLVREGKVVAAHGVRDVELADGQRWQPPPPRQKALFAPDIAWQVMDILADPDARRAVFGNDLPLDLPFAVAAKTGTSRGFSDTVAIGATTQWTVGAWAGNFDGSPIHGVLAMRAAAPLVRAGLLLASQGKAQTLPPRPGTLQPVEVCALSGLLPGPDCPHRVSEPMTARQRPQAACDWHDHDAQGRERVRWPRLAEPWARQHRAFALDPWSALPEEER